MGYIVYKNLFNAQRIDLTPLRGVYILYFLMVMRLSELTPLRGDIFEILSILLEPVGVNPTVWGVCQCGKQVGRRERVNPTAWGILPIQLHQSIEQ